MLAMLTRLNPTCHFNLSLCPFGAYNNDVTFHNLWVPIYRKLRDVCAFSSVIINSGIANIQKQKGKVSEDKKNRAASKTKCSLTLLYIWETAILNELRILSVNIMDIF